MARKSETIRYVVFYPSGGRPKYFRTKAKAFRIAHALGAGASVWRDVERKGREDMRTLFTSHAWDFPGPVLRWKNSHDYRVRRMPGNSLRLC